MEAEEKRRDGRKKTGRGKEERGKGRTEGSKQVGKEGRTDRREKRKVRNGPKVVE